MNAFAAALWAEALKARRSKMPWLTALGFSLAPLAGGFFMIILKDPEYARSLGLIGAKAQITAGVADWPTYLTLLGQATAIGGVLLFGLVTSWVFGREYADRTAKDLLALPTPRSAVVGAKFLIVAIWSAGLVLLILILGLCIGMLITLPGWSTAVALNGLSALSVTAGLTIALVTPVAFVASAGRGYLAPMGFVILAVVLAQIVAAAGWGALFPWSVPALHSGLAGAQTDQLSTASYVIVILTSLVGLAATLAWWRFADQPV
jgi:ABC-type transport system involved in multi-copper enzyme maturation permease subunit